MREGMMQRRVRRVLSLVCVFVAAVSIAMMGQAAAALADTYVSWTDPVVQEANSGTGSPHRNYATTTQKCAVCHSVHSAAVDYIDSSGQVADAELLLRTSAADACIYCHISTAVGGKQIYAADAGAYTTSNSFGHQIACTSCHAVHGANTMGGDVAPKLLKNEADGLIYQPFYTVMISGGRFPPASDAYLNNLTGYRAAQITGFCTKCHQYYSQDSGWPITSTIPGQGTYKTHPLKSSGGFAFAPASDCRSCHNAGTDGTTTNTGVITESFPHYTPSNARFLVAAADAASALLPQVLDGSQDGVCLRCHRSGTSLGVGLTF